jgi:hypothetical protein
MSGRIMADSRQRQQIWPGCNPMDLWLQDGQYSFWVACDIGFSFNT